MDLAPDFDEFIACLIAHGVEFVKLSIWREHRSALGGWRLEDRLRLPS